MRTVTTTVAILLTLLTPMWAQQDGHDNAGNSSKRSSPDACEIRAYLINKERETVNVVGITAMLVVEGKDGNDILIPLQVITSKMGEKYALQTSRAPREVEGTHYCVSLMTLHPEGSRRSEASEADRHGDKSSAVEPNGKREVSPAEADRNRFTLNGPYFKADLTREQLESFTCQASVRITEKGSNHSAKGFNCALSKAILNQGGTCRRLAEECSQIERHLKANEMEKAGVLVDHMSASLSEPCGEASCQHARHGCASCCKDLRAAISSGNREKSLAALDELKSECSSASAHESRMMAMHCSKCSADLQSDMTIKCKCGADIQVGDLKVRCPKCSNEVKMADCTGACSKCGASMTQDTCKVKCPKCGGEADAKGMRCSHCTK